MSNKWFKGWFSLKNRDKEAEAYNYRRKAHEIPERMKNVLQKSRDMKEYTKQCVVTEKRSKEKNPY